LLGANVFNLIRKRFLHSRFDPATPLGDVRYVVIDTELTGLDESKDSIVSVGAVRMTGGRIELGNTFYRLVSPRTELKADSVVIHEITPSEVAEQPSIETVLDELLAFCGTDVMIGHFISIDLSFLNRELMRTRNRTLPNPAVDTFSVYEWLRKRMKTGSCFTTPLAGYRLYDIIKCFNIPVNGAHNAIMDAYTTAQLFQRFLPLLAEAGSHDIGDLLKIGVPFKGGDHFRLTNEFSNF
jgi:DNA polymerase-3 subunit epsilon